MKESQNFGIMSYSFHGLKNVGVMDIFGYLETVRYRYNLSTADIWNGFLKSYDEEYLYLIKQHIDERGLTVVNLCCDFAHPWDDDENVRRQNEEIAWKCLRAAEIFEAKTIRMDVGIRDNIMPDNKLEYVAKKYKEYCKRAASFGAKFGPENHWGGSWDYNSMVKLYEAVGEKNYGILLHLGNWHGTAEEKKKYDELFASRAIHMHINYEHCVDADNVLPPLKEAGYTGCWSIESHKSTNEYNNVAFQLAQVKRVLAPTNYGGKWKIAPPGVVRDNKEDKL